MPSHMSVQKTATQRNALAEILIDYILQCFSEDMYEKGMITDPALPEQQKPFTRSDCSEIYDHYLELKLSHKLDSKRRTIQIWAQTTCYKGNAAGKPEANKTYEIRETLSEALTLRKWLMEENTFFRTIHFTLGPADYTYGWFVCAKKNAFDLSLYPKFASSQNLFDVIHEIGKTAAYEFEFYEKLDEIRKDSSHPLTQFIDNTVLSLENYFISGYAASKMADKQARLLSNISACKAKEAEAYVAASQNSGMDIKGKTVSLLGGAGIVDPVLGNTLKRIIHTNPFLPAALDALGDWDNWSKDNFSKPERNASLREYIKELWSEESENRYVIRRLLLRAYTDQSINYIQDLNIDGIDEHNLYSGNYSAAQTEKICDFLLPKYQANSISDPPALYHKLTSSQAKSLVNDSLRFEQINGTSLKPSFFYLEKYIKPDYELITFEEAGLPLPIAYYSDFEKALHVQPYNNLKVLRSSSSGKNLAVIKGKFFRKPEFPRRAKEESYVGLTAKYELVKGNFHERYPNLPFIMFIDMAADYTPPAFAVRRLVNYGWIPFFQLSELVSYLKEQENTHEEL